MKRKIELDKQSKEKIIDEIKRFFKNERNEEIGDLSAMIITEFIIENIADIFYNKGVTDCIAMMHEKIEDLYSLEI